MIGRLINRLDADQAADAIAEYRKMPAFWVTAQDHGVVTGGNPGDLELQIALVAPKPGDFVIGRRLAGYLGGDASSLVDRILHRFETNPPDCEGRWKVGTVADREDRRIRGGEMMCATCHVYVEENQLSRTPTQSDDEKAMLEFTASERRPNSRLSCQLVVTPELDGLVVYLPETQV
jgi:hypothetical protein